MSHARLLIAPSLLALAMTASSPLAAQSLNIDFGAAGTPSPPASYGGISGSAGMWNAIDPNGNQGPFALADLGGVGSAVTLTIPIAGAIEGPGPCLGGDDDSLLNDFMDPLPGGAFVFDGLANGTYAVVTYSFAADDFSSTTDVEVDGSLEGYQVVGGIDVCMAGSQAPGASFVIHTVGVTDGTLTVLYDAGATPFETFNGFQLVLSGFTGFGQPYCSGAANSTGMIGEIRGFGSAVAADNNLTLTGSMLPPQQFGIFVVSRDQGFVPMAGGTSDGNLCLSGSIGRFVGPGQIGVTSPAGELSLQIDLSSIPQGSGFVGTQAGETWNFQAWHRDSGGLGSNFTTGLSLLFN